MQAAELQKNAYSMDEQLSMNSIHAQLLIQGCEEITTINKKDVKGMSAINTSDDQSHQESLLIARLLGRRLWNLPGIRRSSKRKRPQDF